MISGKNLQSTKVLIFIRTFFSWPDFNRRLSFIWGFSQHPKHWLGHKAETLTDQKSLPLDLFPYWLSKSDWSYFCQQRILKTSQPISKPWSLLDFDLGVVNSWIMLNNFVGYKYDSAAALTEKQGSVLPFKCICFSLVYLVTNLGCMSKINKSTGIL